VSRDGHAPSAHLHWPCIVVAMLCCLLAVAASVSVARAQPNVEGRFFVADERKAVQALADLAKQFGVTDFVVTREGDETVIRISVPRQVFWKPSKFWDNVDKIGTYRPDHEDADDKTDPVRVLLRLRP